MVDTALKNTTSMSVCGDFNQVGSNCVIDELVVFRYKFVQAFLNNLFHVSYKVRLKVRPTWFPLRSLIRATTFILNA